MAPDEPGESSKKSKAWTEFSLVQKALKANEDDDATSQRSAAHDKEEDPTKVDQNRQLAELTQQLAAVKLKNQKLEEENMQLQGSNDKYQRIIAVSRFLKLLDS